MSLIGESYRILNLTDRDEYIALTGQQTKDYNLIISAGLVDLEEGSPVRILLWEMFPEGTITGDRFRDETNGLIRIPPIEDE